MVNWSTEQIEEVLAATIKRVRHRCRTLDIDDVTSAANEGVAKALVDFDPSKVSGDSLNLFKKFVYQRTVDALRTDRVYNQRNGRKIAKRTGEVATNYEHLEEVPQHETNRVQDIIFAEELLARIPRWERFFILDCMTRPIWKIAEGMNVCASRVSQIKHEILNKLKGMIA